MSERHLTQGSAPHEIPMIDLRSQHAALEGEILEAFRSVLATGRFILGDPVESFESDLKKLCDARHAITCNSGTDALWLAMRALDIGPGDAVLCPAYSFFASAATIVRLGATPVFTDIDPSTFNLDPEDAIRRAERHGNIRAVLSVDLFGRLCELGPLESICHERGWPIIEDAAQSIDALDSNGAKPGERSDIACLSFYPTKNLGALGDAGGLVTSDSKLAHRIRSLRVHGEDEPGLYEEIGINSRLDALQAAALSIKLRHLEAWTRARRQLALHYDSLFAERGAHPATEAFGSGRKALQTPTPTEVPARHSYHRYVVRVPANLRQLVIDGLREEGIASEVYYSRGLHQQPALAGFVSNAAEAPFVETELASREALALPLYPELTLDGIERIVGCVTRILKAS
jgi:dTDP-4-amino-4,6-dideoxygalactose transaminase